MCDTIVALGNSTKDGSVLFGKNTDRVPNEAHNIEYHTRKKHNPNENVKCTYISIPQVEETYEVLLLKPFWIFGCEMGSNEFGVTIGNEAVWTKEPLQKKGSLLGMDILRLALERSTNAKEALGVITSLLEKYGQGGNHGYKKEYYHNSYIIADISEAWVLETAGKYWIAERVKDIRSISNTLSIGKEYDLIHPDLISHAIKKGYCKSVEEFDFAKCFIPRFNILQLGAKGKIRQACTTQNLHKYKGKLTPKLIMEILRNHNIEPETQEEWNPSKGSMRNPCVHFKSILVPTQSTGSLVSHNRKDIKINWVTGTSAPCLSTYKPIFLPRVGVPEIGKLAGPRYDKESIWWSHEVLHRLVIMDYQERLKMFKSERDEIEKKFIEQVDKLLLKLSSPLTDENIIEMKNLSQLAFNISRQKTEEWITKIKNLPITSKPKRSYRRKWNKLNIHDNIRL